MIICLDAVQNVIYLWAVSEKHVWKCPGVACGGHSAVQPMLLLQPRANMSGSMVKI